MLFQIQKCPWLYRSKFTLFFTSNNCFRFWFQSERVTLKTTDYRFMVKKRESYINKPKSVFSFYFLLRTVSYSNRIHLSFYCRLERKIGRFLVRYTSRLKTLPKKFLCFVQYGSLFKKKRITVGYFVRYGLLSKQKRKTLRFGQGKKMNALLYL